MSHTTEEPEVERRPNRVRGALIGAGSAGLVIAVAIGVMAFTRPEPAAPEQHPKVETATVTRGDLTNEVRAHGTFAYSEPEDLGTDLSGIVTGLPDAGTIITAGGELFRVNNEPVILMHGDLPSWRPFDLEMTNGPDVRQIEMNLAALGFFAGKPDEKFTASTAAAIKKWQKALGLEQSGAIESGRIVFSQADVRVQDAKAKVGDGAGPAIISVTGVTKAIQALIETSQQGLATVGGTVSVTLPGGRQANAKITAVGAPVEKEGANGTSLKIPVTLALEDPEAGAEFDNVSVSFVLSEVKATDAKLVPIVALLARPGGGFAVEVVPKGAKAGSGKSELVPIELGAFANGMAEVTSGDITEGDVIVVAK